MQIQRITNYNPHIKMNKEKQRQNHCAKFHNTVLNPQTILPEYKNNNIYFNGVLLKTTETKPFKPDKKSLTTTKLSYEDNEKFKELFELDDEEFGDIDYYENVDAFKKYLEKHGVDTYLINDKNGALVGYYQFYMKDKDNLYIENLNLKPEYRGTKTASIFMILVCNNIRDAAIKNGAKKMSLHVHAQNERMISLYERLGFRINKREDKFYDSKTNAAAYYMIKEL